MSFPEPGSLYSELASLGPDGTVTVVWLPTSVVYRDPATAGVANPRTLTVAMNPRSVEVVRNG